METHNERTRKKKDAAGEGLECGKFTSVVTFEPIITPPRQPRALS